MHPLSVTLSAVPETCIIGRLARPTSPTATSQPLRIHSPPTPPRGHPGAPFGGAGPLPQTKPSSALTTVRSSLMLRHRPVPPAWIPSWGMSVLKTTLRQGGKASSAGKGLSPTREPCWHARMQLDRLVGR